VFRLEGARKMNFSNVEDGRWKMKKGEFFASDPHM
jgi:hypothetical protein